jgi:hypothetical protein
MNRRNRWFNIDHPGSRWSIAAVSAIVFLCGLAWQNAALLGGGAVVLCLVLRRVGADVEEQAADHPRRRRQLRGTDRPEQLNQPEDHARRGSLPAQFLERPELSGMSQSTDALVEELNFWRGIDTPSCSARRRSNT